MADQNEARNESHWILTILTSATAAFNMAVPLILVRTLSAEDMARYKIVFLYLAISPWLPMIGSLLNGLPYWVNSSARIQGPAGGCARSAWQILMFSSLGMALLGGALLPWLSPIFASSPALTGIFLAAFFCTCHSNFYAEALIASGRIRNAAYFTSGWELVRISMILVAALTRRDVVAILGAHALALGMKAVFGIWGSWKRGFAGLGWRGAETRSVLAYALPLSASSGFLYMLTSSDQLILSRQVATQDYLLYSLGCLVLPPLTIYEQSVTRVALPRIARSLATGDTKGAIACYRDVVGELALVMIPAVLSLTIFARPVIHFLYTSKYLAAARYLRFYAWDYLVIAIPFDLLARAHGNSRWIFSTRAVFGIGTTLAVILGLRFSGPLTALLGALGVWASLRLYSLLWARRRYAVGWRDLIPWIRLANYALRALVLTAMAYSAERLFANDIAWMMVCGTLGVAAYFGPLYWRTRRSNVISGEVPSRTGGPQVPVPGET